MAKKIFRSLMLGIIVFSVAILAGYLSYVVTYHYQTEKLAETVMPQDVAEAAPVYQNAQPLQDSQVTAVDHYVARFENNDISIYTSSGGKESFLYSLDVYAGDLPAEDMVRLREGIILKTKQELASFEEDFTS